MATNVTYAKALITIKDFAVANGFNDEEVINKIDKLIIQKDTRGKTGKKSSARVENEKTARVIAETMRTNGIDEIKASWVRDNISGVNTVPKAVAILNAAIDEGILVVHKVEKSATRNELFYRLPEAE